MTEDMTASFTARGACGPRDRMAPSIHTERGSSGAFMWGSEGHSAVRVSSSGSQSSRIAVQDDIGMLSQQVVDGLELLAKDVEQFEVVVENHQLAANVLQRLQTPSAHVRSSSRVEFEGQDAKLLTRQKENQVRESAGSTNHVRMPPGATDPAPARVLCLLARRPGTLRPGQAW